VLEWRGLAKLKSTYTDTLPEDINPATGRIHSRFSQTITSTGRLSSSHPNLQNIPVRSEQGKKIRSAFVAPPGHTLLSLDYSQIELRILAHMADIPTLKAAFAAGGDIHALTAAQVFGLSLEQVSAEQRRRAKAINFGIIYGISAFGLAAQLGCSQGEAKAYITAYFAQYPGIQAYMQRTIEEAKSNGFVRTLSGRPCFVPSIRDKNPAMRQMAERAAINAPIQGTAADIMKKAMIDVERALTTHQLPARLVLQVHDEVVLECLAEPDKLVAIEQKATAAMIAAGATSSIPLLVESSRGDVWE
jgi:DNA polymerase I